MKNESRIGLIELVTAVVILSFSGVLIRWAGIGSGTMTFMRTAIPSVILGIWLFIRSRLKKDKALSTDWKRIGVLFFASVLNAVRLWLFFEAFRRTSIGNAIIVLYSWPIFAMIYGVMLLGEKLNRIDIGLVVLSFSGMGIVYSGGLPSLKDNDFVGMSLMLLSAAIYALMIILIRREKAERLEATFWQNLVGAIIFLPVFLRNMGSMSSGAWLWSGMNGLVIGTVGFALLFSAFNRLPAVIVGHISYLEVVFGLIWGISIFGEPVNWRHLAGGGLIITSMILRAEINRRAGKSGLKANR